MKQVQLNAQQNQLFVQRMDEALHMMTMSWDNDLREWYPIAIKSLDFASPAGLRVPQEKFIELFEQEKQGLNMNVVAVLMQSVKSRNASQMGMTGLEWAKALQLNDRIQKGWDATAQPVQNKIMKELEIMANKPQLVVAQ